MSNFAEKTEISNETLFEESYNRVLPELVALSPEDFIDVNLDVTTAVSTVFGVVPELTRHRDAIVKEMPGFDIARFDKIEDYAKALSYAHIVFSTATRPPDGLVAVNEEGIKLRDTLNGDISALVGRGLINSAAIKNLKGLTGYKNVATDLQILGQVLKENWPLIDGKCATTKTELDHALKVAARLLRLAGEKEQNPAVVAAAAETRTRAFTLFSQAYDDARRAIIFLRWHEEDAESIAPSLYSGRGGSRKKSISDESVPAPATSTVQTTTPTASATTTTTTTDSPTKTSTNSNANGPFMT